MTHSTAPISMAVPPRLYRDKEEVGQLTPLELCSRELGARAISAYTTPGDLILDCGCNKGHLLARIADRRRVGLDVGFGAVLPGPAYVVGDVRALPFAADTFDLVAMTEVVEHLTDAGPAYRELYRVLRPGGVLYLTHPNRWNLLQHSIEIVKELSPVRRMLRRQLYGQRQHLRSYSVTDSRRVLDTVGFDLVKWWGNSFGVARLPSFLYYGRFTASALFPFFATLAMAEAYLAPAVSRVIPPAAAGVSMIFRKRAH